MDDGSISLWGWAELHPYLRNAPAAPCESNWAFWAALLVALAWDLSLYRTALAGTEHCFSLFVRFSCCSVATRNRFQVLILVCIGAFTKITFFLSLAPICIIMIFQRRASALRWMAIGLLIGVLPFSSFSLPTEIPSHDGLSLQPERMLEHCKENTGSREQWHNLTLWLFNLKASGLSTTNSRRHLFRCLKGLGCSCLVVSQLHVGDTHHRTFAKVRTLACLSVLQDFYRLACKRQPSFGASPHQHGRLLAFLVAHLTTQKESWTNITPRHSLLLIWPLGAIQLLAQTPTLWSTLDQHGLSDRTPGCGNCRSQKRLNPKQS